MYDFLIVGAGLYGSVCARELTDKGYSCLVVDKRPHLGGNCYTSNQKGIDVHVYGPHIFHTSNEEVWNYINRFATFHQYKFSPVANYIGNIYSLPFNLWTFQQIYGVSSPHEVEQKLSEMKKFDEPKNLEEVAINSIGWLMYQKLVYGYTKKQWMREPKDLPAEIIKRLPVRLTFDNNYFNDRYQGIPVGGYTPIFEKLLEGIDVRLGIEFKNINGDTTAKNIIYTGKIDELFDYVYGDLDYRSLRFEQKTYKKENHQGTAVINFTDDVTKFTRSIEHRHFDRDVDSKYTIVTKEYPTEYFRGAEPYYPVDTVENRIRYNQYKNLADGFGGLYLGGRLAEYKYYDMHQVIEKALNFCRKW
jgi:UDP-galactopyranose mutase